MKFTDDMVPLPIQTDRLELRALTESDADDYRALEADPEVKRFLGGPTTRDAEYYRRRIATMKPQLDRPLAVTRKDTAAFVGRCGFTEDGMMEGWEVNIVLARQSWGLGFASETIATLIHTGFGTVGLDQLFGIVHPENLSSIHLLQKLHFQRQQQIRYVRWGVEANVYAIRPQA